jgi:hypothetical protein
MLRRYGLLTGPTRANNIERIRELLAVPLIPVDAIKAATTKPEEPKAPEHPASSRSSLLGNSQSTARPHFRRRSGSTPHDDNLRAITPQSRSPVCSRLSRPRLSSLRCRLRCRLHRATAPPVFTDRPGHPKNASPPTCITSLTAQPTLAAELICGLPTAKSAAKSR